MLLMNQITLQKETALPEFLSDYNDDKTCPRCGQKEMPFKLGVCRCGNQVGQIQYVKDPEKFARNYYSCVEYTENEENNTAVKKTFAGLKVLD